MNIGISLSGGGYRAAAFHFGVLARLAHDDFLEGISTISTVSGGSLAVGIIFAGNKFSWPTSEQFLKESASHCYRALTMRNLQRLVISDIFKWPFRIFTSRAGLISRRLKSELGMDISIKDLPAHPRWVINSTCYESGADFIFEKEAMGDYKNGYVRNPSFPLSDALAASAGFPVLVGPMSLPTGKHTWYSRKKGTGSPKKLFELPKSLHLWDGGVYDNLGLEQLIRYGRAPEDYSYRSPIDYLVVSNASGEFDPQVYKPGVSAVVRLVTIAKYQIESLRSRDVLHRFIGHKAKGRYFDSDNYCEQILRDAGFPENEARQKCKGYLTKAEVYDAARIRTEIRNLTHEQFMLLFRQGFEVADCTLHAYEREKHSLITFNVTHWEKVFSIST